MENKAPLFIDGWHIDVASHRIARDDVEVRIEPRSMELLLYLAARPNRVVSRKEIEKHVWHGRVVGYQALSGAIVKLRKAFGDTSKEHHVIETVPKSGYRLVAPLLPQPGQQASFAGNPTRVTNPKIWAIVALAVIAFALTTPELRRSAAVTGSGTVSKTQLAATDKPSIVILPFFSVPGDMELDGFAFGLSEDLVTDLSRLPGIFVITRNSLNPDRRKAVTSQQIVAESGLHYVLQGSVRGSGGQLRVNAQLVDATTHESLWAERFDGELDAKFAFQDKLRHKILKALSVQLIPARQILSSQRNASNPQAYTAFLQASQIRPFDAAQEFEKAVNFYQQAVVLDPTYGDAYAALTKLYWRVVIDELENVVAIHRHHAINQMYIYARKSAEFPSASGYAARALIMAWQNRWEEAIAEARKALKFDPNFPNGMSTLSYLLTKVGKFTEAQVYLNESILLDPELEKCSRWIRASILFHLEEYEVAASKLQTYVESAPDDESLQLLLAASHGHLGNFVEGQAAVQKYAELWAQKGISRPFSVTELNHWSFGDHSQRKRIQEGLLKAGMPKY